jgi:hypothetical protein
VPYLRDSRRPEVRPSRLFLLLPLVLLVTFAVLAAPALAYDPWEHGGAQESTCDSSGCHKDQTPSNTACLQSGCHAGFSTANAKKCWDCHQPGSAPTVSCSGTCHLYRANGEHPAYDVAFTHGDTPHLGASGYGKTCAACHADGAHHDGTAAAEPTCARCHNGSYAKAPTGHSTYGTDCTSCHTGMNRPSGDCASCHVGNPSSGGPQITYSNDLTCADAACHTKVKNHVGTPISSAACTTCHAAHYQTLGTCTKCHADPQTFHHATARAIPLNDCATCHNGGIAAAPTGHGTFGTNCVSCHTGMNKPSGDCASCHVGNPSSGGPQISYSNSLACSDAGCHGKILNHKGTPITAAACTECHTAHYQTLGACTKCHADPQTFHHATAQAVPLNDCATCHNGSIAAPPPGHAAFGSNCVSCHTGMNRPSGDCATCHVGKPSSGAPQVTYTNSLSCDDAGCHAKVKNHAGTPITAAACTTCHSAHYETLGTCTTCHTDPQSFHHGTAKPIALQNCVDCHDGTIAKAPTKHESYGTSCAGCHKGMDIPSGSCMECHSKAQGKLPAVTYTNELSCADAQCHAKIKNHQGTSIAAASCTTCHKAHYEALGKCSTCHAGPVKYHHGTAKAVPLKDCAACHDGKMAPARQSHAGRSCSACHATMSAPHVPATCQTCHEKATFGSATCTACHSKASGMFGDKEQVHLKDPKVACTTCHDKPHYEDVGSCDSCHESHAAAHHAQATPAPTKLTVAVSKKSVKKGTRVRIGGTLAGAAGPLASRKILLQARTAKTKGSAFKTVSTLTTGADGKYGRFLRPRASTQYRVVFKAAGDIALQQDPAVKLAGVRVTRR